MSPSGRQLVINEVVSGLDRAFGGPSYSVPRLSEELACLGERVSLLSVKGRDAPVYDPSVQLQMFEHVGANVPLLQHLKFSRGMGPLLKARARVDDIIHVHGLWQMPVSYASEAAGVPDASARLLISPRGMLAPAALEFSRARKQVIWRLFQHRALKRAACLHATAESEIADIRALGLRNPVALIPNGIDVPSLESLAPRTHSRTVLSLGRIHPKKGLDRLIAAFALISSDHPDWRLRIVGPSENGYDVQLRQLAASLGVHNVQIELPVYGDEKFNEYRECEIFVLPTLSENFGLTVAEALACGTPVIATKGAPWRGLEDNRCGFWIDHGAEALAAALRRAIALDVGDRRAMGDRGRLWVAQAFSWKKVASEMRDVYRWLVGTSSIPRSVELE